MIRQIVRAAVILGLIATTAPAALPPLDPEAADPYRWQVVLKVKPHPLLSAEFRVRLLRDVQVALQSQLGPIGTVETVDLANVPPEKREPLWAAFDKDGWPALTTEPARTLTGMKTHFLSLEVKNGVYHLEARQHDGSTGLASPLLRKRDERSADQVGRQAGLLLAPDFGPVGTVVSGDEADPNGIVMRMRGSSLAPVGRFVKPGDLFAVAGVKRAEPPPAPTKDRTRGSKPAPPPPAGPAKFVGVPREYTYLHVLVVQPNGDCRCAVISRFEKGLPTHFPGVVGVRCLKLPTVEAPVQIKLVDKDGKPHPRAAAVAMIAGDAGYSVDPGPGSGFTFQNGTFRSPRTLSNIACLSVSLSPTWTERFPVPVYGDGPVTLAFEVDEQKAKRAELDRASWALRARVAEAHNSFATLFSTINGLVVKNNNREALARLRDGLVRGAVTEKALAAELETLRKLPGADTGYAASQLKDSEVQILALREWQNKLKEHESRLEEAAKLDPVKLDKEFRARDLKALIEELVGKGEVPEALDIFDELIKLTNDDAQRLAKENLLKQWAATTDDHRIAREVILKTWPDARTLEEFEAAVKKLAAAIRECMKQKDKLGLRKLMNTFNPAYERLEGLSQGLDVNIKADEERLKAIRNVVDDTHTIEEDVRDWLKQNVK
jgi:hypothetical protein